MSEPVRLAMLYSAPLVRFDGEGRAHPVDALDFETERELLFDSLSEAGRAIEVRVEAATADNLQTLVTLGCRALHYSGHGHPDFLAFEDGRGTMHPLDTETLRGLVAAGGPSGIQLVFVSACHSRTAGEAFVAAGVPHVVAVRCETPVLDVAARTFARQFYLALAMGKTVRQAYKKGRAAVHAISGLPDTAYEADKFLPLPQYGHHEAAIFADAPPGEWRDATPPPCPGNLPARPEHFVGRNVDVQRVVAAVLDGRLLTVRGAPGIGKTALAIASAHYVHQRRRFRDGVYFVDLRGAKSAEAVRFAVARAVGVEAADDEELFAALRPRRCLLVWDNCEDPLHHAFKAFRGFLTRLLRQARHVKLLLTSRRAVGGGVPGVTEKIHTLRRLDPLAAAGLFAARAPRPLTLAEVGTGDAENALVALAQHPVLDFLSGHPHAIALAAPLLQDRSLPQLLELLQAQPVDALLVTGVPEDERDAATSFAASLGVSAGYVGQRNADAVRLFAVMGLLPGGGLPQDLDAVWGQGWRPLMDALVHASLVERAQWGDIEHFSTFPFVTAYAQRLLTADDRTRFALRAGEHFGAMSESLYRAMGAEEAGMAHLLLALEEENLWACLDVKRPTQPKRDDEVLSPTARVATYLPPTLLLAGRAHDGIRAAQQGREACRAVGDTRGEANTLQALGDLKVRVADLDGARRDYETALPLYRDIHARLGEANTHQGLGNLRLAEGQPDAALAEFRAAFEIHTEIHDQLGVGADWLYMGRAAAAAGRHGLAALLCEEALSIHRAINDRLGQALDLNSQAEAFWALGAQAGALAAWWQARAIFRAICDPSAAQLDAIFAQIAEQAGAEAYQSIIADLEAHAEERRQETVAALRAAITENP